MFVCLKEMPLAWAEDPLRFKVLEDGEVHDGDWKTPPQGNKDDLASSLWVLPSKDTPYYPLQKGKG